MSESRVAIIGSGFSGIAAAVALQNAGIDDFTIFEMSAGVGGTWWSNRYPGAEVDLESLIYSFSFAPADWTRTHASWRELQRYLESVVDGFGLRPHLRLGEKVEQITWSAETATWEVETSSGLRLPPFHAVISAVGFLNIPRLPDLGPLDRFRGVVCHTSAWPAGLDLAGKRVGLLGTGSSAVQVATEAARTAAELTIFQASPNWIVPKGARDFTDAERRLQRRRRVYRLRRLQLYLQYDMRQYRSGHARRDGRVNRRRRAMSEAFLEDSLKRRPDLRALVTPTFPFESKRTVVSDTYYPTLLRDNVKLVPRSVTRVSETGVVDADGADHELDVIVLATGFSASDYLANFRVVGTGGHELHERWAGEPEALLGMLVPGFPNFFIMYGPNTNSIPLVSLYEEQARFAARTIASLDRSSRAWVDVSPEWHRRYNRWLQRALSKTVWTQASSYFKAGTGKVVTQWPFSASFYIAALRTARHLALRHGPRTPAVPDVGTQAMASSDRNGSVAPRGLTLKASAVLVFTAIGRLARPRGAAH